MNNQYNISNKSSVIVVKTLTFLNIYKKAIKMSNKKYFTTINLLKLFYFRIWKNGE